jgi:hypothetical protein
MGKIELGDKVKDTITGYTGIVIAYTHWIHGCDRITVQAQGVTPDGKLFEAQGFDVMQCELLEKRAVISGAEKARQANKPVTGGPRPNPAQAPTPKR